MSDATHPTPAPDTPPCATPPPLRMRIWRRVGAVYRVLRLLFWLTLLVLVALVSGILGTSAGTWLGLRVGLDVYNNLIPGEIRLERVNGSILGGLVLVDVTARDAQGRTLVAFERLELDYTAGMLWRLVADVDRLRLDAPQVWLYEREDGTSAFLDLAPPSADDAPPPDTEEAESTGEFALPLTIFLHRLEIHRATVGDAEGVFVRDASLFLSAKGGGPRADVWVSALSGSIPIADIRLERGGFHAAWERNEATLRDLSLEGSFGVLEIESARFDPYRLSGELHLSARSPQGQVRRWTGWEAPGEVSLRVAASGEMQGASLRVEVGSGGAAARVSADVALRPALTAEVDFSLDRIDLLLADMPVRGRLNVDGRGRVSGESFEDLTASVTLQGRNCRVQPAGAVEFDLDATWAGRDLGASLRARAANSHLDVQARLEELETFNAHLKAHTGDISTLGGLFLPDPIAGRMSVDLECAGTLTTPRCAVALETGDLRWQELSLDLLRLEGAVTLEDKTPNFSARLNAAQIAFGEERLESVALDAQGDPGRIELVSTIRRREGERLHLDAVLLPGPPLRLQLAGLTLLAGGHEVSLTRPATLGYHEGALEIEGVFLRADQATAGLDGRLDPAGTSNLNLTLESFSLAMLHAVVPELELGGTLSLNLGIRGSGHEPDMRLELDAVGLSVAGALLGDLDVSLNMGQGRTRLRLHLDEGGTPLVRFNLDVPVDVNLVKKKLDWQQELPHSASWRLRGLAPSRLASLAPIPDGLDFLFRVEGDVTGTPDDFLLKTALTGEFTWEDLPSQPLALNLEAGPEAQSLALVFAPQGPLPLNLKAGFGLPLADLLRGEELIPSDVSVTARLVVAPLPLAPFNPYLPRGLFGLAGRLSADMELAGTLAAPEPSGWLEVGEGRVELLALASPLKEISLRVEAEKRQMRLRHLTLRGGAGGRLQAEGTVDLTGEGGLSGDFSASLARFGLDMPGLPRMILNSMAGLRLTHRDEQTHLDLRVGESTVDVSTRMTKAPRDIPANPNVRFVEDATDSPVQTGTAGTSEPPAGVMNLSITFDRPLVVRGDLLDMEWDGAMNIRMEQGKTKVSGLLEMERGRFDFLGNDFQVDRASLDFPPGTSNIPFLNLSAQATLPDATVTLGLRGRVTTPELSLQANPPMPEYQVFTLLVSGSVETSDESQEAVQGKAANLGTGLIAYKYPQLQQQFRQRTGIDRVGVSFGETAEQPIVTVGKRVNQRVYLETRYHHNAPRRVNRVEGRVEIQLVPRWTLETYYGDSNIGGVDIFWHMRFAPLPLPPTPDQEASEEPSATSP